MSSVTNTNDSGSGSRRQAYIDSNGDVTDVTYGSTSGTLTLLSALPQISADYDDIGNGLFTTNIGGFNQAIDVNATTVISDHTFTNGNAATGYFMRLRANSSLSLTDCTLEDNNTTSSSAGAVFSNNNPVTLILTDCTVDDVINDSDHTIDLGSDSTSNVFTSTGCTFIRTGRLRIDGGTITASDSTFDGDTASPTQSCFELAFSSVAVDLDLTDCSIDNFTGGSGGAVNITNYDQVNITRCTFEGNDASASFGGALRFQNTSGTSAAVVLTHCTFTSNTANSAGGAINLASGSPATFKFDSCVFKNNSVDSNDGGALQISGNLQGTETIVFEQCTFEGNSSARWGGALRITSLTDGADFINCIFRNNTCASAGNGGAIREDSSGTITLSNCMAMGNLANAVGNSFDGTFTGTFDSMDFDGSSSFTDGVDDNEVDSGLNFDISALADNGGLVETCAIGASSTGKDSGSNSLATGITLDARGAGFNRVENTTVDRGAFEIQAAVSGDFFGRHFF